MDDILTRIINEKELVSLLLEVGIDGYSTEDLRRGILYRILDKKGNMHKIVNPSKWTLNKLKMEDYYGR